MAKTFILQNVHKCYYAASVIVTAYEAKLQTTIMR